MKTQSATQARPTTMLALIAELNDGARSVDDLVELAASLINSGVVRLAGNFAGQTIN